MEQGSFTDVSPRHKCHNQKWDSLAVMAFQESEYLQARRPARVPDLQLQVQLVEGRLTLERSGLGRFSLWFRVC